MGVVLFDEVLEPEARIIVFDGGACGVADETIRITGELVDFDGTNYTINTSLGTLVVAAEQLTCEGEACPYIKPPTSEFTIAGAPSMSELLVPALMQAYSGAFSVSSQEE